MSKLYDYKCGKKQLRHGDKARHEISKHHLAHI